MRIQILKDKEQVATRVAELVERELQEKPKSNLMLATGQTMLPLYQKLREKKIYGEAQFFNLDEYWGVESRHPQSFATYLQQNFLLPIAAKPNQVHLFNGGEKNWEQEKKRRFSLIGPGIDITFLGLGVNGHVAFNEPPSDLTSELRLVTLSEETKEQNFRKHHLTELSYAITMGMKEIFASRMIIMLVTGESKQAAWERLMEENPNPHFPASFIKLHPNFYVFADENAARKKK